MSKGMESAWQLRGVAAIIEMTEMIGAPDMTDRSVAEVLVKYEPEIRELVLFALSKLALGY